jgi:integrase/recombinase XerD
MKLNAIRIVEFTNPSGAIVYRVTGKNKDGNRVRENFPTRGEAQSRKATLENEIENLPTVRHVAWRWSLTDAQVDDAQIQIDRLKGKTLGQAIDFFLANFQESDKPAKIANAYARFIEAQTAEANSRPRTIQNLKSRVGALVKSHGEKLVSEIQLDALTELIFRPGRSRRSQINDRAALSAFFAYCVRKKHCRTNPIESIENPKVDETRPQILPLADCRKLINEAASFKGGKLLPYVALSLFCGIRYEEVCRLSWDKIDLKRRTVTIDGEAAKLRRLRSVSISKNCAEMLKEHAIAQTPIVGENWRRDWDSVKEASGFSGREEQAESNLRPWVADYMRHTAISHKLVQCQHEGETAIWAGNSPNVVQKFYKGLVAKKSDAAAFWKIGTKTANIVKMAEAA